MTRPDPTRMRRSPGPGGRPGFSLIELVMVVWVLGILLAVAVPTLGSARDSARVRHAAGTVAQEMRLAGQLAFAHGRRYSLDGAATTDALTRTPLGLDPEVVLDLATPEFYCALIPRTIFPYGNTLELDSAGDVTAAVCWMVVSGNLYIDVKQDQGVVNPVISAPGKASATEISKFKARIVNVIP